MYFKYTVEFKKTPPSIQQILIKLNEITGLEIEGEISNSGEMKIIDSANKNLVFWIAISNRSVIVYTGEHYMWYLLEATISTLVELGGISQIRIDDLSKKKWEQVRNLYETKNLIDWDGVWPEEEKGTWNT